MHIKYQKAQLWQCVSRCQGFTVGGNYLIQVADTNGKDGVVLDNDGRLRNLKQHQALFKLYKEKPDIEEIRKEKNIWINMMGGRYSFSLPNSIDEKTTREDLENIIISVMWLQEYHKGNVS